MQKKIKLEEDIKNLKSNLSNNKEYAILITQKENEILSKDKEIKFYSDDCINKEEEEVARKKHLKTSLNNNFNSFDSVISTQKICNTNNIAQEKGFVNEAIINNQLKNYKEKGIILDYISDFTFILKKNKDDNDICDTNTTLQVDFIVLTKNGIIFIEAKHTRMAINDDWFSEKIFQSRRLAILLSNYYKDKDILFGYGHIINCVDTYDMSKSNINKSNINMHNGSLYCLNEVNIRITNNYSNYVYNHSFATNNIQQDGLYYLIKRLENNLKYCNENKRYFNPELFKEIFFKIKKMKNYYTENNDLDCAIKDFHIEITNKNMDINLMKFIKNQNIIGLCNLKDNIDKNREKCSGIIDLSLIRYINSKSK